MDAHAERLLETLNENGYEAFVVGGCVRDALLGLAPKDWDITTNAPPDAVSACFSSYPQLTQGLRHGTVTVLYRHMPYEITTYRTESGYTDHRHPDEVSFTKSLREDLSRRDFTINAMAYHPKLGLRDYFGGLEDLSRGIIRCVGQAQARFEEDALRILRALRFACRYRFTLAPDCAQGVLALRVLLPQLSPERIFSELTEILTADDGKILLQFAPVFAKALRRKNIQGSPDFAKHVRAAAQVPEMADRLVLLLWSVPREDLARHLQALRCPRRTLQLVVNRREAAQLPFSNADWPLWLIQWGEECLAHALRIAGALQSWDPGRRRTYETQLRQAVRSCPCTNLSQLRVNGRDLREVGIGPSAGLGNLLQELLLTAARGRVKNEREPLLELARKLWQEKAAE